VEPIVVAPNAAARTNAYCVLVRLLGLMKTWVVITREFLMALGLRNFKVLGFIP
jgi:hypothetical protein